MGECPLCGQPTFKASTRLVQDACGHTKCRLCLLQEENGCSICKNEKVEKLLHSNSYIVSFETTNYGNQINKPLELVNNILDKSSHISCLSFDRRSLTNKDLQTTQRKQYVVIEKECDKIEKNNTIQYKASKKQFSNDHQKNDLSSHKVANINKFNSKVFEPIVESNLEEFYFSKSSMIKKKLSIYKNKNDIERPGIDQSEKEVNIELNGTPLKLIEKNLDKCQSIDFLSIETKSYKTENKIQIERNKQNEKKKLDDILNKSPDDLFCNRSPDFRLSDYLLFKNRNEKIPQNESIGSSTQSLCHRSPDFQLSDYISFKKQSSMIENTTEIEENQNEKIDHNNYTGVTDVLNNSPSLFMTNHNTDNLYKSHNHLFDKNIVIDQNSIEKEKSNQIERINYDYLKCYEFSSYSIIEKKLRDDNNLIDKEENSQNKENNKELHNVPAGFIHNIKTFNCSVTEKIVKINECDKLEINQKEKVDNENKENQEKFDEKNEKEINLKEENNGDSVESLMFDSHETQKIEFKKQENINNGKKKKSVINQLKYKNIKQKNNKNDAQIIIRKGKRKRKSKVLLYEEDFEEPKQVPRKHRKQNRDWSYIVTVPGKTIMYKCTCCEKVFKNLRGKWYHASCFTGQAPFYCQICSRTFAKKSHFEYHERIHTGNKPFTCDICNKSFVQKNKLNRHLLIHKQENDIECAECGKKFSTKQYLKNHMTIHQNNSFKCKFCPKTFTLAFNRKRHERSHSTDRPYKCDICSKDFKGKFLLTRHRRTHEKSRPYSCHNCHKVFLSKFEVQRHMSVHSDIKPYACNQCNLEFRRKDNLNRHIKHHHTIEYDLPRLEEHTIKNINSKLDNIAKKDNNNISDKPISKIKQLNEKKFPKLKEIIDAPVNKLKTKLKPKKISRTISTSSTKSLLKTSMSSPQSHRQINLKPDLSNAVPVIRGPISIKRFTESSELSGTRLGFTQPISLEEAVVLNRRIEEKIYTQDSFCNYPGLNRRTNCIMRRRNSCGSNTNFNDDIGLAYKQNQERSKTAYFSKDNASDTQMTDEPKIIKDINLHWRRRTAESLRTKIVKNKQTQGLAQN